MSKPETCEDIKRRKVIAAWQPQLEGLAKAANVKPAFLRLTTVVLDGGDCEIQLCVAGHDDVEVRHNHKAVSRMVKELAATKALPALQIKRHSHSCESHILTGPA